MLFDESFVILCSRWGIIRKFSILCQKFQIINRFWTVLARSIINCGLVNNIMLDGSDFKRCFAVVWNLLFHIRTLVVPVFVFCAEHIIFILISETSNHTSVVHSMFWNIILTQVSACTPWSCRIGLDNIIINSNVFF